MAGALTEFGAKCRELRTARNLIMADQARALKVSSAFVSAVETGTKSIPIDYLQRVIEWLQLSDSAAEQLRDAYKASQRIVTIRPNDSATAKLVVALAESIDRLSPRQIKQLRVIINNGAG